jgi:hypothetical protein
MARGLPQPTLTAKDARYCAAGDVVYRHPLTKYFKRFPPAGANNVAKNKGASMSVNEDNRSQRRPRVIEYDRFGFDRHFDSASESEDSGHSSTDLHRSFNRSTDPKPR